MQHILHIFTESDGCIAIHYLHCYHVATSTHREVEKAIPLYEQALELDPEFADAWVELGQTYIMLQAPPLANRIPAEVFPIAIEAFKAALEIDPGNSRAMGFLGATLISHEYQWSEGLRLLEQSVALNAGDAEILSTYGINLYFTGHPDASTVLEKAYLLNPIAPSTVYFRAVQLLFDGRWTDAATLMDTQLIQDRERYDTNALAAYFNAYARRFDLAEGYLAKASAVVGADYPFIKRVAYSIARWAGKQVLANEIRDDLLALARHKRVAYLYPLTDDADLDTFVDAIDLAIDQRHGEIFPHLFADRPERIPESDWDRIQNTIRIAEGKFRAWSHGWVRSEEEIAQLQSAAISLSEDELDFYVGVFEDPAAAQRRSIERDGNQLKSVTGNRRIQLLPMGNHHFEATDFKYSYKFTVENGRVTQLKWEAFQTSTVFIKKREP